MLDFDELIDSGETIYAVIRDDEGHRIDCRTLHCPEFERDCAMMETIEDDDHED